MSKIALASLFTLGVLGVFLFIISLLVLEFGGLYGSFGLTGLLILEAILFFITWRLGPWFSDIIYKYLYGVRWLSYEELEKMDSILASFIKDTCRKDNLSLPKIGFIDDGNPQAFTYGSDHWNARIVFTRGVTEVLDENEYKAVFAHELGHIAHRDFIVMTMAAFILSVLYTLGRVLMQSKNSSSEKKGNALAVVGLVSLVFYWIGSYLVLFLSRTREYWADEYSKEKTGSGNYLASALVKIAYGIVSSKDSEKTKNLMEGTRTLGIYDHKASKNFGLVGADFVQNSDRQAVVNAMVYDMRNLWAFWLELSSSHPLTGKRISALLEGEAKPIFDMNLVKNFQFDTSRHYREFATDWVVQYLFVFFAIIGFFTLGLAGALFGVGIGWLISAFYRFPSSEAKDATVDELMSDVYASPIKGKPCRLSGELIGRGSPGYAFSEDFMFRDKTGLLYIDYQHWLAFLGNMFFSLTKAKSFVGKNATCKGWFYRGFGQYMVLDYMSAGEEKLNSHQKTWAFIGAGIPLAIGIFLLFI